MSTVRRNYRVAVEYVSKGDSVLTKGGVEVARWEKTRQRGRLPDEVYSLPDPKTVTKVSTLYDQLGEVTQQWIAEKPTELARRNAWEEYARALAEPLPRAKVITPPIGAQAEHLLTVLPIGDHHLGMRSWHQETGADYDLEIAERLLLGATDHLVNSVPVCARAVIEFLGDFMHYDSFEAVTPAHRNPLDADSRFPKMVQTAVRIMRRTIEMVAARHGEVLVIVEIGNHDPVSSIFLMEALHNIYENDPRITVDRSPKHFHYYAFGKNLIGTHHGNNVKAEDLPLLMATDRAEDWGRSEHRYWHTGHIHQRRVIEKGGCIVESFRVLPPADAWAAHAGYRSFRDMQAIVLHAEHGEVARHTVNPAMISFN